MHHSAVGGARAQYEAFASGLEFATALGSTMYVESFRMGAAEGLAELGRWDEALAAFADVAQRLEASKDVVDLFEIRCRQVVLLARRGRAGGALRELLAWIGEQDATQMSAYIQTVRTTGQGPSSPT